MQTHIIVNPRYGNATLGKEITKQLDIVDTVIIPVNNGSLFLGIGQTLPPHVQMIGIYSYASLAHSICGYHQAEGTARIQEMVSYHNGALLEATEADLYTGTQYLLKAGIFVEPSSASVIGILPKLKFSPNKHICCVISGSGLKASQSIKQLLNGKISC
jgi:threonine synthase